MVYTKIFQNKKTLMTNSLATTSSVFWINRFWSAWTCCINSYDEGSDPSSLRQRWMFIGFSSSSSSARQRVFSRKSSRWVDHTWRRTSSDAATVLSKRRFSRRIFCSSNRKTRISSLNYTNNNPTSIIIIYLALLVMLLAFFEGWLLEFCLFVKERQFIVAPHELSPQNVTLC